MPVPVFTHTEPQPEITHPSAERPVRLVARHLQPPQTLLPHSHAWGQLTYAPEGMLQVIASNCTWFVPPMRAIWVPPGVVHEVRTLTTSQLRAIHIHSSRLPFGDQQCRVLEVSRLLRELVLRMEQLDTPGQREQHLAEVILDELQAARSLPIELPMPQDKRLLKLCEQLLQQPANNQTLAQLAAQTGASARTLTRLFEKELGMGFSDWRQQMRLARASSLAAEDISLAQIAGELGYASQSAFSAMFKKTAGESPSSFFGRQKQN